jgi:hypothetical protein
MFGSVAEGMERPKLFWGSIACIGLATIIGLVMYDRYFGKHEAVDVAAIKEPVASEQLAAAEADAMAECTACGAALAEMEGETCPACGHLVTVPHVHEPAVEEPTPPPEKKGLPWKDLTPNHIAMIAALMIPIVLFASYSGGTNTWYEDDDDEAKGGKGKSTPEFYNYTDEIQGRLDEGEEQEYQINSGGYDVYAVFNLTWVDEDPPTQFHTNEGDRFRLEVTDPEDWEQNDVVTNSPGEEGQIQLIFNLTDHYNDDLYDVEGNWTVVVTLEETGQNNWFGIGSDPFTGSDDGNSYTLTVEMKYRLK